MNSAEDTDNRLTSERIKAFEDALELFYIRDNISARIKFVQEWTSPGQYILGEELIDMDRVGTKDKQRRATLESEAEDRRVNLLETLTTLEEKSAERGVININYVRDTINHYGRATSLLLYSPKVVDKILPPVEGEEISVPSRMPEPAANYEIAENEITIGAIPQHPLMKEPEFEATPEEEAAPKPSVDHMDDIVPISVGSAPPSAPEQTSPESVAPPRQAMAPPPAPTPPPPPREEPQNFAPVPPMRPSSPVAPVVQQSPREEEDDGTQPFVPKAFERVEPEDEPPPTKPGKLKIFGIKDSEKK